MLDCLIDIFSDNCSFFADYGAFCTGRLLSDEAANALAQLFRQRVTPVLREGHRFAETTTGSTETFRYSSEKVPHSLLLLSPHHVTQTRRVRRVRQRGRASFVLRLGEAAGQGVHQRAAGPFGARFGRLLQP